MTNEEAIAYANDWLKDEYALCEDDKEVLRMAIEALQAKTDGDLIRRADAIATVEELNHKVNDGRDFGTICTSDVVKRIESLPSAEPKIGEWIDYTDEGYVECPFCHSATNCDDNKDELHFCFSCGADMRGEQQ